MLALMEKDKPLYSNKTLENPRFVKSNFSSWDEAGATMLIIKHEPHYWAYSRTKTIVDNTTGANYFLILDYWVQVVLYKLNLDRNNVHLDTGVCYKVAQGTTHYTHAHNIHHVN